MIILLIPFILNSILVIIIYQYYNKISHIIFNQPIKKFNLIEFIIKNFKLNLYLLINNIKK
jgi:hypothetical protein